MSIMQSFHFSFFLERNQVIDSVVPEHFLFFKLSTQTILIITSFSSCCNLGVIFQCKFVILFIKIYASVHLIFVKDSRKLSSLIHLSKNVFYPPCLGWRAICNKSLALWYIRCRSEAACLAPRCRFFLMT